MFCNCRGWAGLVCRCLSPANRPSAPLFSIFLSLLLLLVCATSASKALDSSSDVIAPPKQLTVTANLPTGTVNAPYNGSISASGGTAPYTYAAPGLPKGLVINATTGGITGKVTAAGSTTFTAHVKDSAGDQGTGTFTITTFYTNSSERPAGATPVSAPVKR